MKYFKYIDLPNWQKVASKALDYYFERRESYIKDQANPIFKFADTADILEKIPEFKEMLAPLNATAKLIWFFELPEVVPVDNIIHSDGAQYQTRFLLPLRNCERTETRYYVSDKPLIKVSEVYANDSVPAVPEKGSYVHVDTLFVERGPALMRTNELHGIYLPEDAVLPRITMLLDVNEDMTYLLE